MWWLQNTIKKNNKNNLNKKIMTVGKKIQNIIAV